jgi:L-ascorbate metabolism protein UlaG (beta-lactamase superfamily)
MLIQANGLASFQITTKTLQQEVRVVIDPYNNDVGMRFPRTLEAEVVLVSHDAPESNNSDAVGGSKFLIILPGEYEVAGVFVYGIPAPLKNGSNHNVYLIEAENMRLVHLGALDRHLTEEEQTLIGDVDILFVPVGGGAVLGASDASKLVQDIEPRVVIPMFYGECKTLNLKEKTPAAFLKTLGAPHTDEGNKWKIVKSQLPEEEMKIVTIL